MELTEQQFDERFAPQTAPSGDLYEYQQVQHLPAERVWTIVEGDDGNLYASPGFHVVNRLGYVTSDTPWTADIDAAVWCIFEDNDDNDEETNQ